MHKRNFQYASYTTALFISEQIKYHTRFSDKLRGKNDFAKKVKEQQQTTGEQNNIMIRTFRKKD